MLVVALVLVYVLVFSRLVYRLTADWERGKKHLDTVLRAKGVVKTDMELSKYLLLCSLFDFVVSTVGLIVFSPVTVIMFSLVDEFMMGVAWRMDDGIKDYGKCGRWSIKYTWGPVVIAAGSC
jgi:hypothetical protein